MDINSMTNICNVGNETFQKNMVSGKKNNQSTPSDKNRTESKDETAVIYQKSTETDTSVTNISSADMERIKGMQNEVKGKYQQLETLVKTMFEKQGITFTTADEMYSILRSGNYTVDPEVKAQAEKDISEEGYWGVSQTSDRLLSFAKAISGNNKEKADLLIDSVKKGFEEATGSWGDDLPEICKKTLDATIEKLEKWRDGDET